MCELPAFGGDHELDECFGDFRLEAFGVSFAEADDVRDDAAVLAIRIVENLRGAWARA